MSPSLSFSALIYVHNTDYIVSLLEALMTFIIVRCDEERNDDEK